MRYVILGTAGHIDHGKSALVQALTGVDPDRLKEEKERGITVDLGFADLTYPDGLTVGIVDVPGHERLVRNMLAGAGGLDLLLMVFAADEGIMPQSREHLAICNLLRIQRGLIAITKSDLVDKEWLTLVTDEIRSFVTGTFLDGADIVAVSSKTGDNIDVLKEKIREAASGVDPKSLKGLFRLPIDRVFTLKGFGTVVTGTAVSGSIAVDEPVEVLPAGIKSKVRGLQSHGDRLKKAYAGQRVAVNLQGVAKEDIHRGDVISKPAKMVPTYVLDAVVQVLKDTPIALKSRSLVHFHTGTTELTGRVILYDCTELKPGGRAYCQFRFKSPVAVLTGDRYIIRRFSPLMTIGGGEILDISPGRKKRVDGFADLKKLEEGDVKERIRTKVLTAGMNGLSLSGLEGWIGAELREIHRAAESLLQEGSLIRCEGLLLHINVFNDFSVKAISILEDFHKKNPLQQGMLKEALRAQFKGLGQRMLEDLIGNVKGIVTEQELIRLETFNVKLDKNTARLEEKILKNLEGASFQPPFKDELGRSLSIKPKELEGMLKIMTSKGSLVRINDSLFLTGNSYHSMIERLKKFYLTKPEMTVGDFRDILSTSRKYALPFLEYLDSHKVTLRVGDVRKFLLKKNNV